LESTREKVAHKNLKTLLDHSRRARTAKGLGEGGIVLPHSFELPETFGLEALHSP